MPARVSLVDSLAGLLRLASGMLQQSCLPDIVQPGLAALSYNQ